MKKILYMTVTMVFTLSLGLAYAVVPGDDQWYIDPADQIMSKSVEGKSAGGLRVDDAAMQEINNTGRSLDNFDIPELHDSAVKGRSAGGLRTAVAEKKLYNCVTDFSGRSHDTFEIVR